MTVRTSPAGRSGDAAQPGAAAAADPPSTSLVVAVSGLLLGAGALASAPLLPVVGTPQGEPPAAGFLAWPLLAALALVPAVLAAGLLRSAPGMAVGLVLGLAALAPGRMLLDVQLLADAGLAARPELVLPTDLAPLHPGPGLALLLAGHLLTALAGLFLLAARRGVRAEETTRTATRMESVNSGDVLTNRDEARPGLLLMALGLALMAALGLAAPPFRSATGFVLARSAFDAPGWVLAGVALLAVLLLVAACLLATSADRAQARGGLLGLAAGLAAVSGPAAAAGLLGAELGPAPGPATVLAAAAGFVLLAGSAGRGREPGPAAPRRDPVLPGTGRLHRFAGGAALLAGMLAAGGAAAPVLDVPADSAEPALAVARLLAPAALVLVALGLAVLLPAWAAAARPALSVAWVVGPFAAIAVLDPALTATDIPGVRLGPGAWFAAAALAVAASAGLGAVLAGGAEREDVDLAALAQHGADRPVLLGGLAAALFAVPAFVLPVAWAPGHAFLAVSPVAWPGTWAVLAGLAAVMLATVAAAWCRPARAAALLAGAGLVVIVRLAEFPLVASRFDGAVPAMGTWWSLGCLVVLVVAIGLALRPSSG
jgi:hypothetical protein